MVSNVADDPSGLAVRTVTAIDPHRPDVNLTGGPDGPVPEWMGASVHLARHDLPASPPQKVPNPQK